ncbi:MAG: PEP-CTERM sorting domain-containing protein [Planctomycetaceae bacterium]|nr:PEP-CTERM sorting domain-containing protein [Planctomycetaceae bacterium]
MLRKFSSLAATVAVFVLFAPVGDVLAANYGFAGGSPRPDGKTYWSDIANWQGGYMGGYIGANSTAYFDGTVSSIGNTVGGLTLGYTGLSTSLNGSGTLWVLSGTFTSTGAITLGKPKSYSVAGTLKVQGGTCITNGIGSADANNSFVDVFGGVLDLSSASIAANVTAVSFSSGTIQNLSSARITSLSGSGTVSNLTGTLTMDLAANSVYSGTISGSGAGTVAKTGAGILTFDPNGAMDLAGLTGTTGIKFKFDLGSSDLITIGAGGLNLSPSTVIEFANTEMPTSGSFRLFAGNFGTPTLSNFILPTAPDGKSFELSTTADPGYISLQIVPEPATMLLLGIGGLAAIIRRRRR